MYWQGYYGNETTAKAIKYMDGRGTIATCFIRQQNVPSSDMKQHYIVNYVSPIPKSDLVVKTYSIFFLYEEELYICFLRACHLREHIQIIIFLICDIHVTMTPSQTEHTEAWAKWVPACRWFFQNTFRQ